MYGGGSRRVVSKKACFPGFARLWSNAVYQPCRPDDKDWSTMKCRDPGNKDEFEKTLARIWITKIFIFKK